jgi:hypothetical protein
MFEHSIFSRTMAGEGALARLDHSLSMALRRVLILVDGRSDGAALRAKAPYRDLDASLETLLAQGLVSISGGTPPTMLEKAAAESLPMVASPVAAPESLVPGLQAGGSPAAVRQALFDMCRQILGDTKAEAAARRILSAGDEPEAISAAMAKTVSVVRLTVDETKADEIKRRGATLL